jgi:hypothetical protein
MSRSLTTALSNEISAQKLNPIFLAEMDFSEGVVRAWSGYGTLNWNGQEWSGLGKFAGVDIVPEVAGTQAQGVAFKLQGIPSDLVSLSFSNTYQGRSCKLYFGALSDAAEVVVDPTQLFAGRMDVAAIDDDGATASITITGENRLIDLQRPRERRYTDEDQRHYFTDDRGLEFVAVIQDKDFTWGPRTSTASTTDAGGGGMIYSSRFGGIPE